MSQRFIVDLTVSSTFNLPNFTDRIAQGFGDCGGVGSYVNESLPNITGKAIGNRTPWDWGGSSGVFYNGGITTVASERYTANLDTATGGRSSTLILNATRSSSTYQDNAKVQQNAIIILYCIKY